MTRNQLVLQNAILRDATKFALDQLCNMTTDEFSHGKDRAVRRRLAEVLGLEPDDYAL